MQISMQMDLETDEIDNFLGKYRLSLELGSLKRAISTEGITKVAKELSHKKY